MGTAGEKGWLKKNPSMPPQRPPRLATYPDPRPVSNKLLIPLSELLFHALFLPEMKTFSKLTSHQSGATREEKPWSRALHSGLTGRRTWDCHPYPMGRPGFGRSLFIPRASMLRRSYEDREPRGPCLPACLSGHGPATAWVVGDG